MAEIASFGVDVDKNTKLAQNAQDTADEANKKNLDNSQQIANINDPNYLTPFEKPQLEIQMDNFATIYATDKDIATAEGIDFTSYDAAYQAYLAYMKPLTADISTYSPIVRTTFNSLVVAVQNAQKAFNTATQAQYTQAMDKAKTDIANNQSSYAAMQQAVADMKSDASSVADTADRAISSAGFASNAASTASQAANEASQAASSALASATSAQSDASSAVAQASSAAADSKDAKQIAGAVSQSYKTLTDGSTMTIAELQGGLAAKLTKTDLDGYATQTWAQNQIQVSADGINGTISSIKGTVDSHTTSINTLQADSNGFKAQFDTVNGTLSTQSTDIGSIQASSKSLSANFDSLSSDNKTNQHNIGQLQASAETFNSTLTTVQTQVQNSAVGTNLLTGTSSDLQTAPDAQNFTNGGTICRFSSDELENLAGKQITARAFIHNTTTHTVNLVIWTDGGGFHVGTGVPAGTDGYSTIAVSSTSSASAGNLNIRAFTDNVAISGVKYKELKIEKGSVATDWCPNPADNATVTALTQVKQTADGAEALATNNQGDISKLQITAKGIQTTVSDNYSDLKSQNTQTAEAVQTLVSKSPSNIIKDGGFNNAVVGKIPSGWELPYGQIVANPDTVSNLVTTGHPVLQINGRATGNSDNYYGDWFDVQPGDQFYAEFKTRWSTASQTGTIVLGVVTKDITGNWTWTMGISTSSPGNWTKYTGVLTIPVGAVQGRVWVSWQGSAQAGGAVQVTDLVVRPAYATQADMTVLSGDINLRVKKGDVANQFNIDAGGELLQTSGANTKIVLSAPNIIFDTTNPVQIPNANIPGTLTGKTFEAGTITAKTKIMGSEIEAPLIHSPSGSFKLDGNTGDIVGASIHAADNSWGISSAGKIHGIGVTASLIDISGDGTGPDYDKNTGNEASPDTSQGIYSRYNYSTSSGYDSKSFGRRIFKNGYLSIKGDTYLNRAIVDWSADGGGVYSYDQMVQANSLKMRSYNFTGSNSQTDNPSDTEGTLSSRIDITPSTISMGTNWSVSDPNVKISSDGTAVFNIVGTKNILLNSAHTLEVSDGQDLWFSDSTGKQNFSLHAQGFIQSSLLSLKTDITAIDPHDALNEVVKNDVLSYHYKTDDPSKPKSVSVILDDIHPIPEYYTSNIFKSADGTGRNDGNMVGYLMLSIKDLNSRLQKLEGAN